MKTIAEQLKAAWAVIDSPEKWTQGYWARDINGEEVPSFSDDAVCFCSVGALEKAKVDEQLCGWYLEKVVSNTSDFELLTTYNDSHTYEQVASLWSAAIAQAEQEGV